MKRVLIIDKCQDCNIENCKLRTMCGLIPKECPLQKESEAQKTPSWDNAPEWANWLTYDKDGWYWWEHEPEFYNDLYVAELGNMAYADFFIPSEKQIYSRPESPKDVSK